MMKNIATWLFLAALLTGPSSAQFAMFQVNGSVTTPSVQTLKIGGGGFLTGMAISTDGTTKVAKTDTYGAYASVASINSGAWFQLLTASSFPTADLKVGVYGGAYEVTVAPSDPTRIYLYINGFVYKSVNSGLTFTKTNYSQVAADPNNANRTMGRFMAVDPQNANVLYVGAPTQLWVTFDGGATFAQVTSVANATPAGGGTGGILVAFDAHSSVSGGKQQGIWASSYGTGLYHSTDGGTTWALVNSSGMPTTFTHLICEQTGVVYVVDNVGGGSNGALNKYNGSWSNFTSLIGSTIRAVAINPVTAAAIYASKDNGSLDVSVDGGSTWFTTDSFISAADIPWLGNTFEEGNLSVGDIQFDPSVANTLYFAEGIAIWKLNPPTTSTNVITWASQTTAIEQLVTTSMMSSPGNNPIATVEDRQFFNIANPAVYPSAQLRNTYGTSATNITIPTITTPASPISRTFTTSSSFGLSGSTFLYIQETGNSNNVMFAQVTSDTGTTLVVSVYRSSGAGTTATDWTIMADAVGGVSVVHGWDADYAAPSTLTLVSLINFNSTDLSGLSSDGGLTWKFFGALPSQANNGGCIAAASSTNFIIVQSNNGFIFNSTNAGASWTQRNPSGWPTSGETGVGFSSFNRGKGCAADRVTANKFYVFNYGPPGATTIKGVWASTDSGATWTQVSGNIDLTSGSQLSNFTLKSVPGNAGNLFFTPGVNTGASSFPSGVNFKRSTDGGATWTNVANVQDVFAFGFGAAKPGGSGYPAIYIYGWVSGVGGLWESDDNAATWSQLTGLYPNNSMDTPSTVEGDANKYGWVYMGGGGSGYSYRKLNFLLNLDIIRANDNTPMWLNEVG